MRQGLAELNEQAGFRIRIRLMQPEMTTTPRGAFAEVRKRTGDYLDAFTTENDDSYAVPALQVEFFNDNANKARVVAQFAAIRANSIFLVPPGSADVDDGLDSTPILQPTLGGLLGSTPTPIPGLGNGFQPQPQNVYYVIPRGTPIGARPAREVPLLLGMLLIFGGAIGAIRRQLFLADQLASTETRR
jgi:hypothetical protein